MATKRDGGRMSLRSMVLALFFTGVSGMGIGFAARGSYDGELSKRAVAQQQHERERLDTCLTGWEKTQQGLTTSVEQIRKWADLVDSLPPCLSTKQERRFADARR